MIEESRKVDLSKPSANPPDGVLGESEKRSGFAQSHRDSGMFRSNYY